MANTSTPWADAGKIRSTDFPNRDASADVCVIGAGIAGLTSAYLLAAAGKRVIVLDAKPSLAAGETAVTTAHLAWYPDDHFSHVISVRGEAVARAAAASHRAAIDTIERIAAAENLDCDFARVDAYLFAGERGNEVLDREAEAMAHLGVPFERHRVRFAGGRNAAALRFSGHAQFHPLAYLRGLCEAISRLGGQLYVNAVVESIRGGDPCEVRTTHGIVVKAGSVVVATNNPFETGQTLHTKVAATMTYALAAEIPSGSVPRALFWDTEDPYHYVRVQPTRDAASELLIVGGEDHRTGQASDQNERWERLEAWMRGRYETAGPVLHRWSGQVFETADGLGLNGAAPWNGPNVYVITGDSGMGLTNGTLGANLVSDLILGKANEFVDAYSPSRQMTWGMRTRVAENLNTAAQYADWITGGDVDDVERIPTGQGAVVRRGLTKLAVFRDDDGSLSAVTAVCPHLGGIVHWNPGESTWDCPCHGSRFSAHGTCLHGPAVSDLARVELPVLAVEAAT